MVTWPEFIQVKIGWGEGSLVKMLCASLPLLGVPHLPPAFPGPSSFLLRLLPGHMNLPGHSFLWISGGWARLFRGSPVPALSHTALKKSLALAAEFSCALKTQQGQACWERPLNIIRLTKIATQAPTHVPPPFNVFGKSRMSAISDGSNHYNEIFTQQ